MAKTAELDWDDLRYFLRAMRAKTLAGAARSLGVEHTTVGRRLSALERSLGAALVMRGPDGLQLTPLGEKLGPLVEEVERAVAAVHDVVDTRGASVRLAVPSGFTGIFAVALAQPRRERLPFSLAILSGPRPVDLKKGEADLAIRVGPLTDQDLVASRLCDSGFSLYAAEAYLAGCRTPIDPNDLSGHDVIGFDANLSAAPPAKWLLAHAAKAVTVLRSSQMTDVLTAALGGIGLAVLPCFLGDVEPGLRRVTSQVLATQPLSLVYRREARLSEPVRAAIRFVKTVVRQHSGLIGGSRGESKQNRHVT
jgi:DNA-binding transcriptional LysR family regulator